MIMRITMIKMMAEMKTMTVRIGGFGCVHADPRCAGKRKCLSFFPTNILPVSLFIDDITEIIARVD